MIKKIDKNKQRLKKHLRVRRKISGTAAMPRLNVFRSNQNMYAQIIDDVKGVTLVAASTLDKDLKAELANGSNKHLNPCSQVLQVRQAKMKMINMN